MIKKTAAIRRGLRWLYRLAPSEFEPADKNMTEEQKREYLAALQWVYDQSEPPRKKTKPPLNEVQMAALIRNMRAGGLP